MLARELCNQVLKRDGLRMRIFDRSTGKVVHPNCGVDVCVNFRSNIVGDSTLGAWKAVRWSSKKFDPVFYSKTGEVCGNNKRLRNLR